MGGDHFKMAAHGGRIMYVHRKSEGACTKKGRMGIFLLRVVTHGRFFIANRMRFAGIN